MDERRALRMIALFTALTVAACAESPELSYEGPDLVALKRLTLAGPEGFCDLVPGEGVRRLRLYVLNQGGSASPASITSVDFFPSGSVVVPTPPVTAGSVVSLPPVTIPVDCFDPDCEFTIVVDARSDLLEGTGEGNNVAEGRCLGQ